MASVLEFRPTKGLGTCRFAATGCVGNGGMRRAARFRVAICGHPVVDEHGQAVACCNACKARAEKLWAELIGGAK